MRGNEVKGSGLTVQGSGFKGGGAAHFVILSGEKRRVLKNGLSENMRTESKDLSAAKYKNSLPLEGKARIREYCFPYNVRANTRICGKRITTYKAFPAWGRWQA